MTVKMKTFAGLLALAALLAAFPLQSKAQDNTIFAGKIIDAEAYDKNQQQIGEVDDLIIRRSGRVKNLTVEFGGFLQIGGKLVSVSFDRFEMKNGSVVIEATEEQLKNRPSIDYYKQGLDPGYYYRTRPYRYAPSYHYGPRDYYYGPGTARRAPRESFEWAHSPGRFLASTIMYRRLINEEGREIGKVEDLLIDLEQNEVEKIIISVLDILGEEVYVALSYEPLGITERGLVYDIEPETLKDFIHPYQK